MKTLREVEQQERHDVHLALAEQTQSLLQWKDSQREEDIFDAYYIGELTARLRPLFEYFARAQTGRTLGMRAWCVLYAVAPSLINDEPIEAAAVRFGVTQEAVCYQLRLFKKETGFAYVSRVGTCSVEKRNLRLDSVRLANAARAIRFRDRKKEGQAV